MKVPTTLATVILAATLTVSCNSCEKRQASELPANNSDVATEYSDTNPAPDTFITATTAATTSSTEQVATTATTTKKTTVKSTSKKAPNNDGYSAKDGTNAENNDGDMYTKNNEKPMPSGPPIK